MHCDVCELGASSIPATSAEARRRKADAEEIRARRYVSSVKAPAISLR